MCDDRIKRTGRMCDTCLSEKVTGALHMNGRLRAHRLRVVAQAGNVFLHGDLHSYYEKQMAQQIAMSIDEVGQVRNETVVRPACGEGGGETGA